MKLVFPGASAFSLVVVVAACGGDDAPPADTGRTPEHVGQACKAPADCYPGLDAGTLLGEVQCLTRVPEGYCTHLCQTDADCCAVPGECQTGFEQVCAPFESTGKKMCFLSCESEDIQPAPDGGVLDDSAYCATYASPELNCRSSGGGSENRKVCVP